MASSSEDRGDRGHGKVYHYDSAAVKAAAATLTRVQRALALKKKPEQAENPCCEVETPFDGRKSPRFPYEENVVFLSLDLFVQKDSTGTPTKIAYGAAVLDTKKFDRLAPGRNGQYYVEEVVQESDSADSHSINSKILTSMRMFLATCFEDSRCSCSLTQSGEIVVQSRKVILIAADPAALLRSLAIVGVDLKKQQVKLHALYRFRLTSNRTGLVDVIDIKDIVAAFKQRCFLAHGDGKACDDFTVCLSSALRALDIDYPVDDAEANVDNFVIRAKAVLEALMNYAVMDVRGHATPEALVLGGNGGDFPGPYHKVENVQDKLVYQLERLLSLGWGCNAEQIKEFTGALLQSGVETGRTSNAANRLNETEAAPTATGLAQTQDDNNRVNKNEDAPSQEQKFVKRVPPSRAGVTKAQPKSVQNSSSTAQTAGDGSASSTGFATSSSTTSTTSVSQESTEVTSTPPRSGASATCASTDAKPPTKTKKPAPAASDVVKVTTTPMPEGIKQALWYYHRRERAFVDELLDAAKPHCDISDFYKMVEHNYTRSIRVFDDDLDRWDIERVPMTEEVRDITSPEKYIELAKIVANKAPLSIRTTMLESLKQTIVGREVVDMWYQGLPLNDTQRDEELIEGHEDFRCTLKQILDILFQIKVKTKSDLAKHLDKVEARVREDHR